MDKLSRRNLFKVAGAAGAAATFKSTPAPAQSDPDTTQAPAPANGTAQPSPAQNVEHQDVLFFFIPEEAQFVEAAVDRLIPPDSEWPGAAWAGVANFIDRQLAGAYGAGARMYLQGPWDLGEPQQGYQLPFTPAEIYRTGIREIRAWVSEREGETEFWDLSASAQTNILEMLQSGEVPLPSMPSSVFFETLLANTIEGWFADPAYGGNRDMVSWRMIGFPGAYAQYVDLVEEHGLSFERPPMSMAELSNSTHHSQDH